MRHARAPLSILNNILTITACLPYVPEDLPKKCKDIICILMETGGDIADNQTNRQPLFSVYSVPAELAIPLG